MADNTEQPVVNVTPTPADQIPQKKSSSLFLLLGLIGIVLAAVAVAGYMVLGQSKSSKNAQLYQAQNPNSATNQTPTATPVTASNADKTLDATNSSIQQSINQLDTDLNGLNSIDKTQDNLNSL